MKGKKKKRMENQTLTFEQALKNLDTVCANAQGNRESHLLLLASLEIVKQEVAWARAQGEKLQILEEENERLKSQLELRYSDDLQPTSHENTNGQVIAAQETNGP